jgi:hypothetical protein
MGSSSAAPLANGYASSSSPAITATPATSGAPSLGEAVRALSTVESQEAILRLAAYKSSETRTECVVSHPVWP